MKIIKPCIKIVFIILCCIGIYFYIFRFDDLNKYSKIESYNSSIVVLKDYCLKNHEFSEFEKQLIVDRISGIDIFNRDDIKIDKTGDIQIYCDESDGHAWGTFILKLDSIYEENLKKILNGLGKVTEETDIEFSTTDSLGSIYIYKVYKYDERSDYINLYVSYIIPYSYKKSEVSTETGYIKYFINLNKSLSIDN